MKDKMGVGGWLMATLVALACVLCAIASVWALWYLLNWFITFWRLP